ncbi:Nucleoporin nup57 [Cystobasidiomycetes sp. EMM_F5]
MSFTGFSFKPPGSTATPAATPSFSFGASSTAQQPGQTQSTPTAAPSAFSFGNSTSAPQPAAAPAFSFGNSNAAAGTSSAQSTASKPFGAFSFGAPSTSTQSASQPAPAAAAAPFSFGSSLQTQQQQQQPAQASNNLFSSINKPNPLTVSQLLGSSNAGNQQNAAGASGSMFGASQGLQQSALAQQHAQPQLSIEERITAVQNAWNPQSPSNRFVYYFYNLSSTPLTVPLTQLPIPQNVAASPHLTALYKSAVLENPRPSDFVPALATGMDDLKRRVDAQRNMAGLHLAKLRSADIQGKITEKSTKHWKETEVRIDRATREQVRLEERLIRICARLAGLPQQQQQHGNLGSSMTNLASSGNLRDDQATLATLERIRDALSGSAGARHAGHQDFSRPVLNTTGGARLAGIVNELWMVVSQRKAALHGRNGTPNDGSQNTEWAVADESELNKVLEVLSQQQKSLDYLSKTLHTLLIDIDTCRLGFGLSPLANINQDGGDRAAMLIG